MVQEPKLAAASSEFVFTLLPYALNNRYKRGFAPTGPPRGAMWSLSVRQTVSAVGRHRYVRRTPNVSAFRYLAGGAVNGLGECPWLSE